MIISGPMKLAPTLFNHAKMGINRKNYDLYYALIKKTIDSCSYINMRFRDDSTLLTTAIKYGFDELVWLCLSRGATVNTRHSSSQSTPLMLACIHGHVTIARMLLENQAMVNTQNINGQTPLLIAVVAGHLPLVRLLLQYRAQCDIRLVSGMPALSIAVCDNALGIVKILTLYGADVNTTNQHGFTPLMLACQAGYFDIAQWLVTNMAHCDSLSYSGLTPLQIATKHGHTKLAAWLEKLTAPERSAVDIRIRLAHDALESCIHKLR